MKKRLIALSASFIAAIAMMSFLAPGFAFAESADFSGKTVTIYRENGLENVADEVSDAFSDPHVDRVLVFDARSVGLRDAMKDESVLPDQGAISPRNPNFYAKNVRYAGTSTGSRVLAKASGRPGMTISISKTVSVSNSYSCAAAVSTESLSSTLGFSVTGTESISVTGSDKVPQTHNSKNVSSMTLIAYPLFDNYSYEVHIRSSAVQNTLVGRGTASRAVGVDFRRTYQYS